MKKAEDDKKRKEAEDAALPEEERNKIKNKNEAEALKEQGNAFYKKREFN